MNKGTFCISLDTELLWGRHDMGFRDFIPGVKREREIINKILNLFTKYQIGATWAVVGHLFLDQCLKEDGIKHPNIRRPNFPWVKGDWFQFDPSSTLGQNPEWYGKDIVQSIKKTPNQETGSHSFSHMIFGHLGCSKECAESEIKLCVDLARKQGIRLRSFVFPRNSIGHLEVLRRYGFHSFRGKDDNNLFSKFRLSRLLMAAELFTLTAPKVFQPYKVCGLVNIPASMYFASSRGIKKIIPARARVHQAKSGIDKAISERKVFHLWFHPTDLVDDHSHLMTELEEILSYAHQKREEDVLEIKTMGQIASRFL